MKTRCKVLLSLIYVTVLLFNMGDSTVMAAEQNLEVFSGAEAEPAVEAFIEAEPEPAAEPSFEADAADVGTEPAVEDSAPNEPEQPAAFETGSDIGQTVSDGSSLIEWLESHKDIGGTVKLTDHVTMDGEYSFCPSGINMPAVFVDTDKYTITITGEIELLSDNHVFFSGRPEDKGIFYVAQGGMLSLSGITVESGQCALWQEEGAGLVEEACHISGHIHYADMPFVVYQNSPCVVVEKGQVLSEVLPTQISCTVNKQGQVNHNEWIPLSWNLEGTEKQQKERRRFGLQGSFLEASSAKPAQCTVVYNDYPLTFTEVKASISSSLYTFRGWYTKPEEALPITVMSEYSLDGESWITYEETEATDTYTGFFIAVSSEACDRAAHPNIYIRLRWDDNGTSYFSNVLCYAADNLDYAEDIGGSRGGGTSIVNPPEKPQKGTGNTPSEREKPVGNADRITASGSAGSEASPSTNQTENGYDGMSFGAADSGSLSKAEFPDTNEGHPADTEPETVNGELTSNAEPKTINEGQSLNAESKNADEGPFSNAEPKTGDHGQSSSAESNTADEGQSANVELKNDNNVGNSSDKQENMSYSVDLPLMKEQLLDSGIRQSGRLIIAAGFVLLSVIAGIVGVFAYFRSGTNR